MKKENVIMYVADQWRSDSIGLNGNECTYTPNLDKLAEDGVNFSNAYCQNPVCVPSRSSFLTGLYPHTLGHRTMHFLQGEEVPNIMRNFKNAGYEVFWGGRNDFLHESVNQMDYCDIRFDPFADFMENMKKEAKANPDKKKEVPPYKQLEAEWRAKPGYKYSHYRGIDERNKAMGMMDWTVIEGGINYIKDYDVNSEKPFFMYLAGILPHPPYGVIEEYLKDIKVDKIPKPIRLTAEELEKKASILRGIRDNQEVYKLTDEELIELKAVYYAMGTQLDDYLGKLFDSLHEKGIYDETTIVFFSDHGDYTGDYEICEKNQNTFEDAISNVPLIIKPASHHDVKVRSTDALVELIDVQKTLHDLCDVENKEIDFGLSLKEVLAGKEEHRKYAHCEGGRTELDGSYAHDAGHAEGHEYWPRTIEQTQIPQHSKALMVRGERYKYVFRLYETDEFYDLEVDPFERNNIFSEDHSLEIRAIIDEMKYEALSHMVFSSDFVPNRYDKRT